MLYNGPESIAFVQKFFTGKIINKGSHTINYGYIIDDGKRIDEVLVNIYRGKKTFTGEEMVEINCHGGVYITKRVLEVCIKNGARIAERGEFSKRAFLNGRIDLSQAEAISAVSYTHLDVYKRQDFPTDNKYIASIKLVFPCPLLPIKILIS